MIAASRRWFRRYRTPVAIGVGVVGFGYVATQYLIGKISDARERISSDRIARANLSRRFEQNQDDCTFTVLALLPTAVDNILAELDTERISDELQQRKAAKLARNCEPQQSEPITEPPSVTDEDGRSMVSLHSESGIHASQLRLPTASNVSQGPHDRGEVSQMIRRSKFQLWNDLKISAITRSFTMIYVLALLTLLTRTQLNLLGRRSYLSSVISLAAGGQNQNMISLENHDDDNPEQAYGNDFETNRKYLTLSWWLLHRGWRKVMLKVQTAVNDVFGSLSPRDDLSLEKFSRLTLEVRKIVEGATVAGRLESKWLEYLLPPKDQEDFVLRESGMTVEEAPPSSFSTSHSSNISLRRLLDETSDLIDTPPFAHVLTLLLDAGFSTLVDEKISQQVFKLPPRSQTPEHESLDIVDTKTANLPKFLAVLTRQAHAIGDGAQNEYLEAMDKVRDLEAFAAVVYSSNWENEIYPMHEAAISQLNPTVSIPTVTQRKTPIEDVETKNSTEDAEKNSFTGDAEKNSPIEDAEKKSFSGDAEEKSPIEDAEKEGLVDVGTTSTFESAWGKAVDSTKNY
ncbi:hypothetical protein K3495_g11169 [Podosphaera aphanis]|nr:hypothetical protein K3495_g11169 [Podosphaera aphanis]